jgi:ribosomal protein S1
MKASDVLKIGDEVEVVVLRVDRDGTRHSIKLTGSHRRLIVRAGS